jgi:hypothetical protein
VTVLERVEAIAVLKELLDKCNSLDGHLLEISPPVATKSTGVGYQIVIKGVLNEETQRQIKDITVQNKLFSQVGSLWKTKHSIHKSEPDTLIIYRK